MTRKSLLTASIVVAGTVLLLWMSPVGSFVISGYQIKRHKEHLKNGIDHAAVRAACVGLLKANESKLVASATQPDSGQVILYGSDPTIPTVLRDLPARRVVLTDTSVRIDCGGGGFEDHYGILFSTDSSADLDVSYIKLIDQLYYWH